MNPKEYIKSVKKTESIDFDSIRERMSNVWNIRLDHASDGLVTEAGEFKDAIKKFKFYGKELDRINLIEELGDILWYVAIACDELNIDIEDVMERNIAKLHKRYGIKFNEEGAITRDLSAERYVLEKNLIHFTEHSLELDGIASTPICGGKNGRMISLFNDINCVNCIRILRNNGYTIND